MIVNLIKQQKQQLIDKGLYRHRELMSLDSIEGINFSSNDYLALRNDPRIKQAFAEGFTHYPAGSGASMVVCGYHDIHQQLEQQVARQLRVDEALLFNSGYTANLAIISLLARLNGQLIIDKGIHASIYDGLKLADANYTRYSHNNLSDLEHKILSTSAPHSIITEGIFSMSGEQADLAAIAKLASSYQAVMVVDESHSFGVLGEMGLGAVVENALSQEQVPLRLITFGKAMGCQGAIVAGQAEWIALLFQVARSYIYTTGMSPALAYGLSESFPFVLQANKQRQTLFQLVNYFKLKVAESPLKWRLSNTPIQQLQLGCPHKAMQYAARLRENGIICQAMREPTVCRQETGLRVVLNAKHNEALIDNLFTQLHRIHESAY